MKKIHRLISGLLIVAVVFTLLFQTLHSYEHVSQQLSEKKCQHKYHFRSEITHTHHNSNHCFVCEFTLNHVATTAISFFEVKHFIAAPLYTSFYANRIAVFYKGSFFALRAPPVFIV